MGQKVNPIGFRLGVNRGWDSVWYAKKKDFGNYLIEDFKIREYIKKNVVNSGVSKVMIERTSNKCFVTIYTSRPGFVIGWGTQLFGDKSGLLLAFLSAAAFGAAHLYQGIAGVLSTGLTGLIFGILYLLTGRKLLPVVLAHMTVNFIGITQIYLGYH